MQVWVGGHTLSTNVGPSLLVAVHKAGVDVVRPLKTTQAEIVSSNLLTSAQDGGGRGEISKRRFAT